MLKQSDNQVIVEGILSEVNLKTGEFDKDGVKKEYVNGSVKIRLHQMIGEEDVEMELPIYTFCVKYTNKGTVNPAYTSVMKVMNDFVSIASCGNEEDADRIRVTSGEIKSNEFVTPDGKLVVYPRVEASFFSKVRKDEYHPGATFKNTIVVINTKEEENKEQETTGRLIVTGGIVQYGEKLDVVDFVVAKKSAISHINANWENGDTVIVNGKLNYSSKVDYIEEEMDFGDSVFKPVTTSIRDFIIESGSGKGVSSSDAYDKDEIKKALVARKVRLDEKVAESSKKKPATSSASKVSDLGF